MSDSEAQTPDFEKALNELEGLVDRMEQGELTLEQSLAHFERGIELSRQCTEALNAAQLRVEQLTEASDDAAESSDDSND